MPAIGLRNSKVFAVNPSRSVEESYIQEADMNPSLKEGTKRLAGESKRVEKLTPKISRMTRTTICLFC